jgi:hypothetical protein
MRDEDIDMLKDAKQVVDAADLPADLRAVGFWWLLQLGSADPAASTIRASSSPPSGDGADPGEALQALAERLSVSREAVDAVYYLDDESRPAIGLAAGRLGRRTAEATRRIALLLAVGRQFDGREQFTSADAIRAVCQEFNAFDSGNFAKTLLAMTDVFQFQGSGSSRKVRLTRPGYEQAASLVRELAT